ncbi:MAG: hypothetical protein JSU79_05325 [Dehalococcoidales bacterium]|nr:MAG: hypothetical protein JSU79_05325 [Dehalococcoidales bacterium]
MKKMFPALLVTVTTVLLLIFSSPISAKGGDNSPRPGNGQGDTKHEHYGPPGHSDTDARPGWGYGDRNHYHYGYGYRYRGDK